MYSVDIKLLKIPSYRRVGDKDVVLILIIVKSFILYFVLRIFGEKVRVVILSLTQ